MPEPTEKPATLEAFAPYEPDDGPLTAQQVRGLRKDAAKNPPKGKTIACKTLFAEATSESTDLTTQLSCQVTVEGEPSSEEDQSIPGTYDFVVDLKRAVDPTAMTVEEKSEIACKVLDCFHDHIGIDCLEDFFIGVSLASGAELVENDTPPVDLVAKVSHES